MYKTFAIALSIFLFSQSFSSSAQSQLPSRFEAINVGYFGHLLVHPGLSISTDYYVIDKLKIKAQKDGDKILQKTWFVVPQISYFHQVRNQNAFFLSAALQRRRETSNAFYIEYGIGPSFAWRFNAGETYSVPEPGAEPEQLKGASTTNIGLTTSYVFGWKFNQQADYPMSVFLGPQVNHFFNYNNTYVPEINFMIGIKRSLSNSNKNSGN
ncbi:MAG: hypothetical protein ACI8ZN_002302 [Bacteroidia bacterium]|jgi:hypothetical protein